MAGRYLRTKLMAVLYISTQTIDNPKAPSDALSQSLQQQSSRGWTTDPTDPNVIASLCVDPDTRLAPRTVETVLRALTDQPSIDGLIADAVIGGLSKRRPAWSPTRILGDPGSVDLLVIRHVRESHCLGDRLDLLGRLGPEAKIHHLPAALVRRDRPAPLTNHDRQAHAHLVKQWLSDATATRIMASDTLASNAGATDRFVLSATNASPPTSIVIPTAGAANADGVPMVQLAIEAVRNASTSLVEVLLVVGDEFVGDPVDLEADDVQLVRRPAGPWNFSASVNLGILAASHPHVLLLNDDVELIEPRWLDQMSVHLHDQQVGAVGALLLYPDQTVQHVGIITDDAYPLHPYVGRLANDLRSCEADIAHEVIAVTAACLLARRADLLAVGGFNESLPHSFNDVDLCMKLHRSGRRVVVEPHARLIHHESASRPPITNQWEWDRYIGRWGDIVDPWYHPGHHRPDDPGNRRANADHLEPTSAPFITTPRDTTLHPRVHHARIGAASPTPAGG